MSDELLIQNQNIIIIILEIGFRNLKNHTRYPLKHAAGLITVHEHNYHNHSGLLKWLKMANADCGLLKQGEPINSAKNISSKT